MKIQERLHRIARLLQAKAESVFEDSVDPEEFDQVFKEQLKERFLDKFDETETTRLVRDASKAIRRVLTKTLEKDFNVEDVHEPEASAESGGYAFEVSVDVKGEKNLNKHNIWVSVGLGPIEQGKTRIIVYTVNAVYSGKYETIGFEVPANRATYDSWNRVAKLIVDDFKRAKSIYIKRPRQAMMPMTDVNRSALFKMTLRDRNEKKIEECLKIEKEFARKLTLDLDRLGYAVKQGSSATSPWLVAKKKQSSSDDNFEKIDFGWGPRLEIEIFAAWEMNVPIGIQVRARAESGSIRAEHEDWLVAFENDDIDAKRLVEFFNESLEKMK